MDRSILVVNSGSTSLKLTRVGRDGIGTPVGSKGWSGFRLEERLRGAGPVDAVAHRVVHGGAGRRGPERITPRLLAELSRLSPLAPLHQPRALAAARAALRALPGVPQVACFDTAFHRTLPPSAATYPVPGSWRRRGAVRYGFHGLAHEYLARRAAGLLGRPLRELSLVTCQLGGGASLAAVERGRSVDTTMGFTPLEGLPMASRSGSIDPGLVTWAQRRLGLSAQEVEGQLERASGLKGLAGTPDMRRVLARARAGDRRAELALEVYLHRLARGIAAMTASLSGLDAVVFGGGVGFGSPAVREGAAGRLAVLGLRVDRDRNRDLSGDRQVEAASSRCPILAVETREELEIARQTSDLLGWT
jgi:acetate kinase